MSWARRPAASGCSPSCGSASADVRQGPDGLLYVLTDADDGAILRLEPVE